MSAPKDKLSIEYWEWIEKNRMIQIDRHHSEFTKEKIRQSHIGKKRPDISEKQKNRKLSEITKNKIRIKMLGRKCSEETIKKRRLLNLGNKNPNYGKHHTEETKEEQR